MRKFYHPGKFNNSPNNLRHISKVIYYSLNIVCMIVPLQKLIETKIINEDIS